jgi:hypothetical protein
VWECSREIRVDGRCALCRDGNSCGEFCLRDPAFAHKKDEQCPVEMITGVNTDQIMAFYLTSK